MRGRLNADAARRFFTMSRVRLFLLLAVAVLLLVIGLSAWLWDSSTRTHHLTITGGNAALNRHKVAEHLKRHGRELHLAVDIRPTEGTPEAVRRVQAKELDLALVNGLMRFPDASDVRQVATLTYEPVHLLVKRESAKQVADFYAFLNGKSVDVGPQGFETGLLAEAVLKFLGLKAARPGDAVGVQLSRLGIDGLFAKLDELERAPLAEREALRAAFPDAVFHGSTLPSPLAQRLIKLGQYELVPLPFAKAFAQVTVDEEELDRDHIDQIHVEPSVIPAYTYGGTPAAPSADCPTLGSPLIVIVHKDVPDEVVTRILDRIFDGPVERLYHPPALADVAPTYPFHPAALAYRDRDKPIVRSDVSDLVQQLFSVVGPLFGGCLGLYGYYRWRQVLRFLHYFRRLQELDMAAKGFFDPPGIPPADPERVRWIEEELQMLQRKAVEDFCRNYFYGEGVLENFLSLLAETRDVLRRRTAASHFPHDPAPQS